MAARLAAVVGPRSRSTIARESEEGDDRVEVELQPKSEVVRAHLHQEEHADLKSSVLKSTGSADGRCVILMSLDEHTQVTHTMHGCRGRGQSCVDCHKLGLKRRDVGSRLQSAGCNMMHHSGDRS